MKQRKVVRLEVRKRLKAAIGHRQQRAFAKQIGVPETTVSLILHGWRRPSLDVAARIEAETGIPAREFASHG